MELFETMFMIFAEKTAQSVKYLLGEQEDLSVISNTHIKPLAKQCGPVTQAEVSWGFLALV